MEQAPVALTNMVSRGIPLAEARAILGLDKPAQAEKLVVDETISVEELREQIKALGGKFAPNTGVAKLRKILEELQTKSEDEPDML